MRKTSILCQMLEGAISKPKILPLTFFSMLFLYVMGVCTTILGGIGHQTDTFFLIFEKKTFSMKKIDLNMLIAQKLQV